MKEARVLLRETNTYVKVQVTDESKPIIEESIISKWESITTILARLLDARAGLINRLSEEYMEIFVMSNNDKNPYKIGSCSRVGHGDYCEMVVGKRAKFALENASKEAIWKDSLYMKYNFISYYGLPLLWPDGQVFGTLCVIDDKENVFSEDFQSIFTEFKYSIEKDLEILMQKDQLAKMADHDSLTQVYNRRKLEEVLSYEFDKYERYQTPCSLAVMDFDDFKAINDSLGHQVGDQVLVAFTQELGKRVRQTDLIFRLGGDEFVLVCPNTDLDGIQKLMVHIQGDIVNETQRVSPSFGFSYGLACFDQDGDYSSAMKRADDNLYRMKGSKRQK